MNTNNSKKQRVYVINKKKLIESDLCGKISILI